MLALPFSLKKNNQRTNQPQQKEQPPCLDKASFYLNKLISYGKKEEKENPTMHSGAFPSLANDCLENILMYICSILQHLCVDFEMCLPAIHPSMHPYALKPVT